MSRFLTPLAIAFWFAGSIPIHADDPKPNFVVIFIDDMGYGDIGPFGSTKNRTPNLNRMAAEGMTLTSFYAAPVCSASRAQLMTGCYAPRVSVPGVFFPGSSKGLNPKERTIAEYLSELGYATACFGKWHLGDQREFLPTRQGFDTYLGIPYSNDMGRVSTETGEKVSPLMRDESVAQLITEDEQRNVTRIYTEEAIQFIEKNTAAKQPFFVYLPHTAVHVPLHPHPDFVGTTANGMYGDWVAEVDWSAGQILDALRRLRVAENTLVLFTSDNGPWASKGAAGGESGPLRGAKGGTLEGGVREPTLAWWPGKIAAGRRSDAITGTTDVLPTFVALAGGTVRDEVKIDGIDQSPLLLGDPAEPPRNVWHYFQGTRLKAVRSGPWKLALEPQSIGMGFANQPRDIKQPGLRLYNLEEEIGETTNVATQHPDVVARLQKIADAMIADIGSGKSGPGVRPAGEISKPAMLYPSKSKVRVLPKRSARPLDWDEAKNGAVFSSRTVPSIADKAFSITATISGDSPEGIVISHGGKSIGYALYLHDDEAVFALRHDDDEIDRLTAPFPEAPLQDGKLDLVATVKKNGTMELKLTPSGAPEKRVEATRASRLLKRDPRENLCIGHDEEYAVDPDAPKGAFTGKIESIRTQVTP
ncbi:MAG: sulfatase [Verrucomicrobiae bacterium]|nr:sulfatase [Verrucomicrobiae bacterium]